MSKKIVKTQEESKVIYLGPTIKEFGLSNGSIYDGFTNNVKVALEKYPKLKNLIFPVNSNLGNIKSNLLKSGTKESILFNSLKKELGGK